MHTTVTMPDDGRPIALDVVGDRMLLVAATLATPPVSAHPELHLGDRRAWVITLQLRLPRLQSLGDDIQLAADGAFGPLTDSAVRSLPVLPSGSMPDRHSAPPMTLWSG